MCRVFIKKSDIDNLGVFARQDIECGEIVIDWDEKKLTDEEMSKLLPEEKRFLTRLDDSIVYLGEPARYVNHSCNPNTKAENGTDIAVRRIREGDEITADYEVENVPYSFECHCRSPHCRRLING